MDTSNILFTIFYFIVLLIAILAICVSYRDDYYDEISTKLSNLVGIVFINDKEGVLDFLHFAEVARKDRVSIDNFKKQVTYMVTRSQEKHFISDETASKILEIVYRK